MKKHVKKGTLTLNREKISRLNTQMLHSIMAGVAGNNDHSDSDTISTTSRTSVDSYVENGKSDIACTL